jgi:hypothetical protein
MQRVGRRTFLLLIPALGVVLDAEEGGRRARGTLVDGPAGRPALKTGDGKLILPSGDRPTEGVLHDKRLLGSDMELVGHFEAPDRFVVDPIHLRAIFVYKEGKRLMVTYWCDLCSLRYYTPGDCWCCQQPTKLDLREPDDK